MSLRSFHVFFITVALGLLGFMVYWAAMRIQQGANGSAWMMAVVSSAGLLAGVPYLGWFLNKTKQI